MNIVRGRGFELIAVAVMLTVCASLIQICSNYRNTCSSRTHTHTHTMIATVWDVYHRAHSPKKVFFNVSMKKSPSKTHYMKSHIHYS